MSTELGAWLRQQREGRRLTRPELARQLIQAGRARGDKSMPGVDGMIHNIYRWERGTEDPSERYKLCYCQLLGIPPGQFGPRRSHASQLTPSPADPREVLPRAVAYRGIQDPTLVEREVLMAAHDGSEHAERAEQRGIGDATLEQFRADVTRLSREYMNGEPLPLFLEMRRVRGRMHDALDRRMWPRDATELYLLLGCLNELMAMAAYDLGFRQAAEELLRAGWAYAVAIDHRPLMALLRHGFASITASESPQHSRQYAESGLQYLSAGPNAAALHLFRARAAAYLGDAVTARQAIADAGEASDRDYNDDILTIGGEFATSRATLHSYAGWALLEIPDAPSEAAVELEQATELYGRGSAPGQEYGYGVEALARINLATARLRAGALDAARAALGPVLALPPESRILDLPQRLSAVRAELAAPIFQGSAQARELNDQLEDFGRETIVTGLHSLPGG
jgi:transcriptional regulator with XRE-family HTH domain